MYSCHVQTRERRTNLRAKPSVDDFFDERETENEQNRTEVQKTAKGNRSFFKVAS